MSTVIADTRDGIMMADKQMGYHSTNVTKIFKVEKASGTFLLGGTGSMDDILAFVKSFRDPSISLPEIDKDTTILLMDEDKGLWIARGNGTFIRIEEDFFAIGSGGDYAMGALEAGATAKKALSIAARRDQHTNNRTTLLKLPKRAT